MDKKQLESKLLKAVEKNLKNDGWAPLMLIGKTLIDDGIKYKEMGYDKLFSLIRENKHCLNWRVDDSNPKFPVIYIRKKTGSEESKYKKIQKAQQNSSSIFPSIALSAWASMGDFKENIEKLRQIALPERWYYKDINPNSPSPILSNYLTYTFYKLQQEKDKIIEKDNYAAFNTGLVDKRYEPIFALFSKTKGGMRQWKLENFCIAGEEREGKELVRYFNPLPQRAHYADKVADMLYDTLAPKPELDWHHIVVENVGRLPLNFLEDNCPLGFKIQNAKSFSDVEKELYYDSLSDAIKKDSKTYRNITNRFKDALELSLKRVEWNFKTAIPVYFPTRNSMSLLLPLALMDDETVDVALVVEKTPSGNYLGHTILSLDWAYSNARLICRPDSDWLTADKITSIPLEEDIEEI